jgi:LacI family transcriptional regulator
VNGRRKGPTLKDVAERAKVSTATVARVLHNSGYVADETRRQVEVVLTETGYQINALAQGLRTQRTFTLGHVVQSIAPNPFFAGVARGVEEEAARQGCGVVLYTTQLDPERERKAVQTLIRRRVDAIIFTKVAHEPNVELALNAGIPVVQVERVSSMPAHAVTADNYVGSVEATSHLIRLGHRKIAFLGVDPNRPYSATGDFRSRLEGTGWRRGDAERLAGYVDVLAAHDLPLAGQFVDLDGNYYDPDWARTSMRRLLSIPEHSRPTAVFATCDMLAAGALQEIYAHGLRVPHDISVIGYDDTFASHLTPPLTTVRQPMLEMGEAAARLALGALSVERDESAAQHERLSTYLVERESTGRFVRREL